MEKLSIMDVRIDNLNMSEALSIIKDKIKNKEQFTVYTPNTEIIMMCQKDKEFMNMINKSDMNVPDGIGLIYASKIKKHPLKEKVAGFELSLKLLEMANENKLKLYLVGGKPGVADTAAENIKKQYPDINIVGVSHGYFKGTHLGMNGHEEEKRVLEDINNNEPDILFVGFGAKKQEQWIDYNKDKINAKILIGNGGTIDVLAGNVKRAPDFYVNLGLEWLYRLIKEPSRISRQIVLPVFMLKTVFGGKNIVKEIK